MRSTSVTSQDLPSPAGQPTGLDLAVVVDALADAFVAVDGAWRFTMVNVAAEAYLGKSREQLLGQNLWTVFPEVLGTESERGCGAWPPAGALS